MWRSKSFISLLFSRNWNSCIPYQQQGSNIVTSCITTAHGYKGIEKGNITCLSESNKMRYSTSSTESSNNSKRNKHWNFFSTTASKLFALIALGSPFVVMSSFLKQKRAAATLKLDYVNKQIHHFYGPLHGNRLLQENLYNAIMKEKGGLKNYLRKARETKNGEDIRRWRSYVCKTLYPLDKEVQEVMRTNAHLICESEFPEVFKQFIAHSGRLEFTIETWKNSDGTLRSVNEFNENDFLEKNNAIDWTEVMHMLEYVTAKYSEMTETQKELNKEANTQDGDDILDIVSSWCRK